MKNIILLFTLAFTIFSQAQNPIIKTIGEFSTLKVYDLISVELIQSKENKVEISGKNASEVEIINKKGTLKIRLNLEESFDGNKTDVKLFYSAVDIIDVNEGANISSEENIEQFELELKAQEGGLIKLKINTKHTTVKAISGGVIEIAGTTNHQKISIGAGGIFKGEDFKSESTDVSIKAGGEAHVNTIEVLDIKIRAGGDVYIYGDPKKVNESKALGGRIKRMN